MRDYCWRTASLISLACLACLLALVSCRGVRELGGTESRRGSREAVTVAKDSVSLYVRDSVVLREKDDTVWLERWSVRYRDRWRERRDTVVVRDSVMQERTVEVARSLTGWQQFQVWSGRLALLLLAATLLWKGFKRR